MSSAADRLLRRAAGRRALGLAGWGTALLALAACDEAAAPSEADGEGGGQNVALEVVAELPVRPGNIAVGPDGRLFLSLRPAAASRPRMTELRDGGELAPFPNAEWNRPLAGVETAGDVFVSVLGVQADPAGVVWMLDDGDQKPGSRKLVGWDTQNDELAGVYLLEGLAGSASFLNDLAIDTKHRVVYIADTGDPFAPDPSPAILVVNLATGTGRRVVFEEARLEPEDVDAEIDGRALTTEGPDGPRPFRMGLNPITIDPANEWVYFGALNGEAIYRIATADLLNTTLSTFQLSSRVELYGVKPVSDGITIDGVGNVYVTDLNSNSIGVTQAAGTYRPIVTDKRLSWPNSLAFGPDDYVYATVAKLHLSAPFNGGEEDGAPPYYVLRFPALAPGAAGR